jgi:hypothetical protein
MDEEFKPGEIRTVFTVVVSDDKRWTEDELLEALEEGRVDWNVNYSA